METSNKTKVQRDPKNKQIKITRAFDAPLDQVWKAWTEAELLDQWWAPKPWKTETKHMDFREGGHWLYAMVGPDGSKAWCRADYETITPTTRFTGLDGFCDEQGNPDTSMPGMHWDCRFREKDGITEVEVLVSFSSEADMNKIVEMGFEVGFTAAHGNLDELLAKTVVH